MLTHSSPVPSLLESGQAIWSSSSSDSSWAVPISAETAVMGPLTTSPVEIWRLFESNLHFSS